MAKTTTKQASGVTKSASKSKATKAKTAGAKASKLSEDKVVDSESEDESSSYSATASPKEAEPVKKANNSTPKVTERKRPTTPEDSSGVEESESESEKEAEKAKAQRVADDAPAKTNGVKRKADESSSSEEESDEERPDAPVSKKARTDAEESSDEDEDESEESSDDDSEEDESEPSNSMEVDTPALPAGVIASSTTAQVYKPPEGYKPLSLKASFALTSSSLEGKQLWHLVLPSNIPISSLTSLDLEAIQSGNAVLTHDNVSYTLASSDSNDTTVLLPSKSGYTPAPIPLTRILHLRQQVELPNLSSAQASLATGSNTAANVATAAVTAIRPQPKGMRMRYKPPGFGSGQPGVIGSDSEGEEEEGGEAVFQFPKKVGMSSAVNGDVVEETPKKKKKDKDKSEKKSKKKEKAALS